MNKMKKVTILLVLFCFWICANGQQIEEARNMATKLLAHYPGLSVAVGIKDSIIWSEGFGYADVTHKVCVTENTTFRMYSLSKSITGIALAKLISAGKLELNRKAVDYLPNLPEHYKKVTVAQLIGHSAGVRHYKKGEWMRFSKGKCLLASDALEAFINDPLVQNPGTSFQYSTFGYIILSAIIESITKSSFDDYIRQQVCKPMGISNIFLDQPNDNKSQQSIYYDSWDISKWKAKEATGINNSCKMGGGGLIGSARSLALLHLGLLNGKLLDENTQKIYYTGIKDAAGKSLQYGFGLKIGDRNGKPYFSHAGSGQGGSSVILIYPDEKAVIVLAGNMEDDTMNSVAGKMLQLFLD